MYLALIGDLVSSRNIQNRQQIQKQLLQLMDEINQRYKEVIISPFTVTTGDEFQALLKVDAKIFQLIDDISLSFLPYVIRFGVGSGQMLTDINLQQSIGSDGPAFWNARKAINLIHQKNDYGATQIAFCLGDEEASKQLNALTAACEFIKSRWTDNQTEILKTLLTMNLYQEEFENKMIAHIMKISPSAFNKRLKASGLKIYLRNKEFSGQLFLEAVKEKK